MRLNQTTRRPAAILALAIAFAIALAGLAGAQGTQTGVLTGTVTSADGAALPGVSVSIKSAALQGERTAVTDSERPLATIQPDDGHGRIARDCTVFGDDRR